MNKIKNKTPIKTTDYRTTDFRRTNYVIVKWYVFPWLKYVYHSHDEMFINKQINLNTRFSFPNINFTFNVAFEFCQYKYGMSIIVVFAIFFLFPC